MIGGVEVRVGKDKAINHLDDILTSHIGRPFSRSTVRDYCRANGLVGADLAYQRLYTKHYLDMADGVYRPGSMDAKLRKVGMVSREAAASVALDRDERMQTLSVHDVPEDVALDAVLRVHGVSEMVAPDDDREFRCPPSPLRDEGPVSWFTTEPVAVFSDFHIPAHDDLFIERAVKKAQAEGVRSFIIAGDLTDNNQWHPKRGMVYRTERRWQDDIDLARSVLGYLCASFPNPRLTQEVIVPPKDNQEVTRVHLLFFGNHDEWIINMLKGQATSDWLYAWLYFGMPVHWSYKRQIILHMAAGWRPDDTPGKAQEWRIMHGEKFSHANPMKPIEDYALHMRSNILAGHMHYAIQWETGPYGLILNGGCFNRRKQDYVHERPYPMRETQTGFTIIHPERGATLYAGSRRDW